jgi:methyltransferase (TIGR00027 family)
MENGKPSRTALAAAAYRAAHQEIDRGFIFKDPLAARILGDHYKNILGKTYDDPAMRRMRIFIAVRTRFAEDVLAHAVDGGTTQLVVLGAGLDTFSYRTVLLDRLKIFEVDHPATQAWKRERLAQAEIPIPTSMVYAPIDFESNTLAEGLASAGFDPAKQTFFTWLGVVPYLTQSAIWSTLDFIAALPAGGHVVFDYGDPPDTLAPQIKADRDRRALQVAALGEAWLSHFEPSELHASLKEKGFNQIDDIGPREIVKRFFPNLGLDVARDRGGHVLLASTLS